jgi:hypothetical protein
MFDDFKKLLSVFNAHSVKYLVVDGYAVSFHAQPRATKDLDLFLKADPPNAKATYAALASFGAPSLTLPLRILRTPENSSALGGSWSRSRFSQASMAWISMRHGRGVSKA